MEILAIIPARGGSKAVKKKNIKPLGGKPLLYYTVSEALKSSHITRVVLSTDAEDIAACGRDLGVEVPFLRPPELAQDHVQDLPVFEHALRFLAEREGYRPDAVAHLRPTAPLRTAKHIDEAIGTLLADPSADSVRSVTEAPKHPYKMWKVEGGGLTPFIPKSFHGLHEAYNYPRQKLPKAYIQNGSIDVMWARTILEKGSMSGERILAYVMEEADSVNIDTELDFELAARRLGSPA